MLLHCGSFNLDLSTPKVMGIVNVTPDSFSDGGLHLSHQAAIAHAKKLIQDGADILDIGGESTRPGAAQVSEQKELERVIPVIEALRQQAVPISIDTCKPNIMRAAIAAGATIVNDINALQSDAALDVLVNSDAAVCLMHKQGTPQTMQHAPQYQDVLAEVITFLQQRLRVAQQAGIAAQRLLIDPGFGFGKTLTHNVILLKNLSRLNSLGAPLLVGLSRKSMLGTLTGREVNQRLAASVATALIAVQHGAAIVRVHDVAETVDALKIWQVLKNQEEII